MALLLICQFVQFFKSVIFIPFQKLSPQYECGLVHLRNVSTKTVPGLADKGLCWQRFPSSMYNPANAIKSSLVSVFPSISTCLLYQTKAKKEEKYIIKENHVYGRSL